MLEFPYMRLPGGILRPIVAVGIEGPTGVRLVDGLLDTGSDRTIFPQRVAQVIGVALAVDPDGSLKTAGGVSIAYRLGEVVLELRSGSASVRWRSTVAFAEAPLTLVHLGYRGLLEYFHATFQGPEEKVLLEPQASLPGA